MTMTAPSVFVGTYKAYNNGSLKGKWFYLEAYSDRDEFYDAIKAFHCNPDNDDARTEPEDDPEFMFQDWEGIPDAYISECWLHDDLWDNWVNLTDDERELLTVYLDHVNADGDLAEAKERFQGKFNSPEDWAEDYWENSGLLSEIPENLRFYIDYQAYARDCRYAGDVVFVEESGECWVFSNC